MVVLATIAVCAPPLPGWAQSGSEKLENVERSLEDARREQKVLEREAGALEREIEKLRHRSVAVAAKAQEQEETLTRLEGEISELQETQRAKTADLARRRQQLTGVIAALQRLSRHPPVALVALPTSPTETVRSAILLRAAVPAVEERAKALHNDLRVLGEVREAMAAAREKLDAERARLSEQQQELAALVDRKSRLAGELRAESEAAEERARRLGEEAHSLRELVARIAEARRREELQRRRQIALLPPMPERKPAPPPASRSIPSPPAGSNPFGLPVRGSIERQFGGDDEFGQPSRGVTVRTRGNAQIVAPREGEVVFAGPFRGYGQLLIIEHGQEYHVLLAGMARIDVSVGDKVMAGEPVGTMGDAGEAEPRLYLELRRKGRPVNPLPWLAAGRTEVNG